MREFNLSEELKEYLEVELKERKIPYSINYEEKNVVIISAPVSGNFFHRLVKAAKAAYLTQREGILHVSPQQLEVKGELRRLMEKHKTRCYVVC